MITDNNEQNVLICDDSITNVMILSTLLETELGIKVHKATDPRKVNPMMDEQEFDLILLDIEMPHLDGFQVMEQIRQNHTMDELPIAILTGNTASSTRNRALEDGANDFINKPFDQTEVMLRVSNLLKLRQSYKMHELHNKALEKKVELRTKDLNEATENLIYQLAMAGEIRDKETGQHVIRVGKYARLFAEEIGLPDELCFMIEKTAPMHDIGKIGIPDAILLKTSSLDEKERKVMDTHPQMGAELLGDHPSLLVQLAASIALNHHEKWDGSGYPAGLKGESIPIEGRITCISDVFDALITQRPYKDPWPIEKIISFIQEQSGITFDPALAKIFIDNTERFVAIHQQYAD